MRLNYSFKNSSLAFRSEVFVVIRVLSTLAVVMIAAVAFIFTCGVPWNVPNESFEDKYDAMLCRNVLSFPWYFELMYICAVIMLLSSNLMNWVGYMNRLTKLIQMKLRYTLSFNLIVQQDIKRKDKTRVASGDETTDIMDEMMSSFDDEDYDDDVDYPMPDELEPQSRYRYSTDTDIELDTKTNTNTNGNGYGQWSTPVINENSVAQNGYDINTSPFDSVDYGHHETVMSQSTMTSTKNNRKKPPPKIKKVTRKDIKNRMIARRKPDELRFYNLIRKQSVLTGVVSISSCTFWVLQLLFDKGSIFFLTDIIVNVTCVYLSVTWSKQYYNKFCSKLECCCCCCEDVKLFSHHGFAIHIYYVYFISNIMIHSALKQKCHGS